MQYRLITYNTRGNYNEVNIQQDSAIRRLNSQVKAFQLLPRHSVCNTTICIQFIAYNYFVSREGCTRTNVFIGCVEKPLLAARLT